MTYLTKDQILGADDLRSEDVGVPEWGGTVRVRTITGADRDRLQSELLDTKELEKGHQKIRASAVETYRARLVALCVVDEHGNRLFDDRDVKALGRKSSVALDRVVAVAQRLNAITAAEVEELTGNSDAAPSGSSTSA